MNLRRARTEAPTPTSPPGRSVLALTRAVAALYHQPRE